MRICVLFCVWDLTKIGSKIKITNWKQNPASNLFLVTKKFRSNKSEMTIKEVQGLFWCSQSKISQKTLFISNQKQQKKWKCQCGCCRKNLAMMWEDDTVSNEQLASLSREYFEGKGFSSFKEHLFAFFSFGGHSWMLSALCSSRSPVSIGEIEKPLSCVHFHPVVEKTIMNKILAILVLFCLRKSQQVTTMEIPLRNVQQQLSKLFSKSMASSCLCCIFDCEHQNQPWASLQQNPKKVLHDFVWISNVNPIEFKFHCILDFVLLGFLLLGVLCVVHLWRSIFVCEIFWNLTPKQLCISDSSKIQVSISRKISNENCAFKHNTNVPKTLVVNHSFTSLVDLGFHITVPTIRKTCQLLCQPLELQLALFFSLWCERVLLILSVCSVWQRWVNVPNHILSIQTQLCEGSNQEKTSSIDTILAWHVTLVHCKLMINTGDLPQSNIATSQSNWHFSSSSKSSSPSSHKRVCKQDRLKKKRICSTDKEKRAMQAKKKRKFGVCVVHHTTRGHVFTKEKSDLGVFVMCLCCLKPQFEFGIHQK